MDAHDLFDGNGESVEGVVRSQILFCGEGKVTEIFKARKVIRANAVCVKLCLVHR